MTGLMWEVLGMFQWGMDPVFDTRCWKMECTSSPPPLLVYTCEQNEYADVISASGLNLISRRPLVSSDFIFLSLSNLCAQKEPAVIDLSDEQPHPPELQKALFIILLT